MISQLVILLSPNIASTKIREDFLPLSFVVTLDEILLPANMTS